jgi:hypothetical protein
VTAAIAPSDAVAAATAFSHDAGFPIRIAVAIVCGSGTGSPRTIGAAPAAWNPNSCGGSVITPSRRYSEYPSQWLEMFPAFPTGTQWRSGARPSASQISNAAVFCPSRR